MKQYEQHMNWQYRTGTTTKKWEEKEEKTPGSIKLADCFIRSYVLSII